jgi:hypothetical protein
MLLETKGRCRNEAKKYLKTRELLKNGARKAGKLLKTKRITSLKAGDSKSFARELTAI